MNNILLSIIIPVKNIDYWETNIIYNISLFKNSNFNYEFIFVYSFPLDPSIISLQKILSQERHIVFCLEKGNSIYSAMNKGIESANGYFLIFVGADDSFNKANVLNFLEILKNNQKKDLFLFEVLLKDEKKKGIFRNNEGGISSLIHWTLGQPRIHQGIVYKRSYIISKNIRYLTSLKVTSDYIFTSEVFSHKPLILKNNLPIIFYNTNGFSSKFSYVSNYLEHIKGFYFINRLRKYLILVIFSRIILIFYKFIIFFTNKLMLLFK